MSQSITVMLDKQMLGFVGKVYYADFILIMGIRTF
jgi:hypothetical protein